MTRLALVLMAAALDGRVAIPRRRRRAWWRLPWRT